LVAGKILTMGDTSTEIKLTSSSCARAASLDRKNTHLAIGTRILTTVDGWGYDTSTAT
jgi:hypothetical protein